MEMILKYIEARDLRQWNLPNIKAFNIGLGEWRSKLNCITNPLMYQQVQVIFINLHNFFHLFLLLLQCDTIEAIVSRKTLTVSDSCITGRDDLLII